MFKLILLATCQYVTMLMLDIMQSFQLEEMHSCKKHIITWEKYKVDKVIICFCTYFRHTCAGVLRDAWADVAQSVTPISLLSPAAVNWLSLCLSIIPFTYTYRIWCSTSEAWEPGQAQHKGTIVVTLWHGSGGATSPPMSRRPDDTQSCFSSAK